MAIGKAVIAIQTTGVAIETGCFVMQHTVIAIQHTGYDIQQAWYHLQTTGLGSLQKQYVNYKHLSAAKHQPFAIDLLPSYN